MITDTPWTLERIVVPSEGSPKADLNYKRWSTTTQWSLVLAAGDSQASNSGEALALLCQRYWRPVYAYVRRRGYQVAEAQDLTQGFFAQLLEKKYLRVADRGRGAFRWFLLASVKHYLANEWDREQAQKRGGGKSWIQLDFDSWQEFPEPASRVTPETIFERQWARTVLQEALDQLREEASRLGNARQFDLLKGEIDNEIRYILAAVRS